MSSPTPPQPTDDPYAALRSGVDAHRQLTDAAKQAAATAPAAPAPAAGELPEDRQ